MSEVDNDIVIFLVSKTRFFTLVFCMGSKVLGKRMYDIDSFVGEFLACLSVFMQLSHKS